MDLDKLLADEDTTTLEVKGKDKKPVKKEHGLKGKPSNGKNSPLIGDNGLNLEKGDNTRFLQMSMKLMELPSIDLKDADVVEERIMHYFSLHAEQDMKPTVMGLGIALGLDRRRLWEIKTGSNVGSSPNQIQLPPSVVDMIKKAYFLMENQWEQYMLNGKVNPVTGIFLGKNNFGYQDKTEYVLTPNTQNDNDYDADAIRERYIAADQQKRLSEGGDEPTE